MSVIDLKMDKLKPCPFCGGKPYLTQNYLGQNYVRCPDCGAVVWGRDDEDFTEKDAVKAWNRRASDA